MRLIWTTLLLLSLVPAAIAQEDPEPNDATETPTQETTEEVPEVQIDGVTGAVSIASKGLDVRDVLFDLFDQGARNFVLAPNVRHTLYLSLAGVEFEEALYIVCETAGLGYEQQNGIFYIAPKAEEAKPIVLPKPQEQPRPQPKPLGKLTEDDLQKRLTTRMPKADIGDVFQEFSNQTGIIIEIDENVPNYKIDAYLIDTSLKYALDIVTRAANLKYSLTNNKSIKISKK
jgi:type II secretory pathway component GspD/PulD (secretin)